MTKTLSRTLLVSAAAVSIAALSFLTPRTSPPARASQQATSARTSTPGPLPKSEKFILHKFEQPIGEETYTESDAPSGPTPATRSFDISFRFVDRGTAVALAASLKTDSDLTPQSFTIAGNSSRSSRIDEEVEAQPDQIRSRIDQKWTNSPRPTQFFSIAGYAPATTQLLLVRYWAQHGSPETLATFPTGTVQIQRQGQDAINIAGHEETLDRYTIRGLIWGLETLWFTPQLDLVAIVTVDAELDHFEAIRDGYEGALPTFVRRAGENGIATMAQFVSNAPTTNAGTLAIVGATLIDGTGNPPLPNSAVVIRNGKIVAAGPRSSTTIPSNAEVIDVGGKFILPGLWDMHAHFEQVEWGPIYLAAGITTVRDCGNELEFITAVRDAIANGHGLGPRILAAGVVDGDGPLALGVERVNNADQAKEWVDRYHSLGFQQIKIYSSMTEPNVASVTAEAHHLGMTVTGHIPEGMNAYQGVGAGMDQINHIQYIAEMMVPLPSTGTDRQKRQQRRAEESELDMNSAEARKAIDFLKAHGTVLDPTLVVFESFTVGPDKPLSSMEPGVDKVAPELAAQLNEGGAPPEVLTMFRKLFGVYVQITGALHRAGVPIVAGTDQSVPGYSLYRELELYVQAGFTPLEAIQAATIVPARVMKQDRDLGTIEAGKRGDLIILTQNPIENIHNIRSVETVVSNGTLHHSADLWRSVGFKP
jgi:imidazolonepropionase-like amidohydrolase